MSHLQEKSSVPVPGHSVNVHISLQLSCILVPPCLRISRLGLTCSFRLDQLGHVVYLNLAALWTAAKGQFLIPLIRAGAVRMKFQNYFYKTKVPRVPYIETPVQRQLSVETVEEVQHLLELKVNKKLLRDHVANKTGQVVTLKDISNVQTAVRGTKSRNDLKGVVEMLKGETGMNSCRLWPNSVKLCLCMVS